MRRRATALVALLALGCLVVTSAAGQTVRLGNLVVSIDGSVSPHALPKRGLAPISLNLEGELGTADGSHPPALKTLSLQFDRHGRLQTRGLPTCRPAELRSTLTARARRVCGDALVGSGRVTADIALPEQAPFGAGGPLLIFNGPPHGGRPTLVLHVHANVPAPTTFVVTVRIGPASGPYGTTAFVKVPSIVSGQGSLTSFRATLRKSWRFDGRRRSLLLASCPNGHLVAKGDFEFADGRSLSGTTSRSCSPLPG